MGKGWGGGGIPSPVMFKEVFGKPLGISSAPHILASTVLWRSQHLPESQVVGPGAPTVVTFSRLHYDIRGGMRVTEKPQLEKRQAWERGRDLPAVRAMAGGELAECLDKLGDLHNIGGQMMETWAWCPCGTPRNPL